MTPRTLQCEVFWAFLASSEHSGVLEDSKSPTLQVLGFTPTLAQSGVATFMNVFITKSPYTFHLGYGYYKQLLLKIFIYM
jgi:hypothetical protein